MSVMSFPAVPEPVTAARASFQVAKLFLPVSTSFCDDSMPLEPYVSEKYPTMCAAVVPCGYSRVYVPSSLAVLCAKSTPSLVEMEPRWIFALFKMVWLFAGMAL